MNGKEKFLKAMNIGCCKRMFMRCNKQGKELEHKYLANRWPEVNEATDPSLILWENLGIGKIRRWMRAFGVLLISVLLMILGFTLVIGLIFWKDQYSN